MSSPEKGPQLPQKNSQFPHGIIAGMQVDGVRHTIFYSGAPDIPGGYHVPNGLTGPETAVTRIVPKAVKTFEVKPSGEVERSSP